MEYYIREINREKNKSLKEMENLLKRENIAVDGNLDYSVGLYDDDYNLVATGSCFTNTLRCLAVDKSHQGEGLLEKVVTHLMDYQINRGYTHLFLYTKVETAKFFSGLGFYEIARVNDKLSFMENRKNGFASYLSEIESSKKEGSSAALIMNCNPFTLGHLHILEYATKNNDWLHLFVVSEDASLFPFKDRFQMIKDGCIHIENIIFHETGSYMISNAVFPSYFLKDENEVIKSHAALDIELFIRISKILNIEKRYVGEEPFSAVTNIYNSIMKESLANSGIECIIIPRKEAEGDIISASKVRKLIHDGKLEDVRKYVPETTYDYFFTDRGKETVKKIVEASDVVHY